MNKIKLYILCLVIFLTMSFVNAAEYTVTKLPNGQTVVVYEIHNNPIVTIDTWIKTGSINETDANTGVSHFLEHLFFKGTKAHPSGDFNRILESKGATVNAATSKDFTHYYITIPSDFLDTALELHSDMLLNPQIPRKELEQERKVVLEEIAKDGNTPAKRVYDNMNDLMYKTHPYKRKVIGKEEVIGVIRREEILDYFNKYYAPSNMVTLIIGDVDTAKVLSKIQALFNQNCKKPPKNVYKKERPITTQRRNVEYMDAQAGYIIVAYRVPAIASSDVYALETLAAVLGVGNSSRLVKDIKEQKNLAFSILSSNLFLKDDGIFWVKAEFDPHNAEKLEKEIFKNISDIQINGISEEELNVAKNRLIQDTYYSRESTDKIAQEMGYIMALTGDANLYSNYIEGIKKVDSASVQRVAKKYLESNKSVVSLILPNSMKEPKQEIIPKNEIKKVSEKNGIIKYSTDNGATILVNQNQNNDIVAISILAKGGEFIEKVIGEGTLTAETILKGTKKYSSSEISKILDENAIEIKTKCENDYFLIDVKTTTAQLSATLDIINEMLNNATFDDYELEKQRSKIISKIKQKRDIPLNIAKEEMSTSIYENSVYSRTNKIIEKYLPAVTRADVLNYYNKITDSKNMVISVSGKVNPDEISKELALIVKDKNAPKFSYESYKLTKLSSPKIISKNIKNLQTSWLFMGWQTAGVNDKNDFVTLKVIDTIIGSGLSSRLYRNLREADGLAYQLGSNYSAKKLGGIFMLYIGTNPKTLEYSRNKMLDEINRLKVEFVSDSELQDAKDRLKGGFILKLETNSSKAFNIGLFETYGMGYDFLDNFVGSINKVTASDIIKVANKYFTANMVQSEVK